MNLHKQLLTLAAVAALALPATAQEPAMAMPAETPMESPRHGIGIHIGAYDFYGPQTGEYFTSPRLFVDANEADDSKVDSTYKNRFKWFPMVRFTYWYRLNKFLDLALAINAGNADYPASDNDLAFQERRRNNVTANYVLLLQGDVRVNLNILPREKYIVSPYVFGGLSVSRHSRESGLVVPVGAGANVALDGGRSLFLNVESGYRIGVSGSEVSHLNHLIGFNYFFKPGYRRPEPAGLESYLPPPDADRDGTPDSADRCPTIAGPADMGGCPDTDRDSIADDKDACPLVAGTAALNGCPDSDGDGIADNTDKCPYVAGTADRQGCPIPDADNDGFTDDVDRCPNQFSKTNNGCPEIRTEIINRVQQAAKAIFFETGKATLKKVSYKQLDAVVAVLRDNPELFADIEGHTDDVGDDASNLTLSQNRAKAVVDYFVSNGIDATRLESHGYGEARPIATNETAAGKAQNRRTEIKLRNYR